MSAIIKHSDEAPPPLDIFEREKRHPDNLILLQERLAEFQPLKWREKWQLEKKLRKLHKQLRRAGYNDLILDCQQLMDRLTPIKNEYAELREQYQKQKAEPEPDMITLAIMVDELARLKAKGLKLANEGKKLQERLSQLSPLHYQYQQIGNRLDAHRNMMQLRAERQAEEKQFLKEAKIIERLMRDTFARTTGCHYVWYDNHQRRHVDVPRFQRSGIDSDSHWFLLAASEKNRFGWRSILPYSVNVADLIHEKTLHNLSVATGRQVEVRRSSTGAQIYFRVNRLDSPDGLPRKILWRQMFEFYPAHKHDLLPWPVGVMPGRKTEWKTFGELPHLLIAGSSQSGKSNEVNCIVATLVKCNTPHEARVVLIDNKGGVEFTHWQEIPHLLGKMVKVVEDMPPILNDVIKIMKNRLAKLEAAKVKDIAAYNRRFPETKWARIVVIIDELATILGQGDLTTEIHNCLRLLTSQGRATGIHTVMCTQMPNVEILPGNVKANLSVRMSGAMPSGSASMTILDSHEAKELPRIPGRMVIGVGADMFEVQTAYISDEDIAGVVAQAKQFGEPPPIPELAEGESDHFIVKPFTVEDFVEIALEDYGGQLTAKRIHKVIENGPSESVMHKWVHNILKQGGIVYKGVPYQVKKVKRAYYLVNVASDESPIADEIEQTLETTLESAAD